MGHSRFKTTPAPADAPPGFDVRDGLDDRLRAFVERASDDPAVSWADRILSSLVAGAVRGEIRSQHEVFRRIGAAPGSHRDAATLSIDDATARRVLEAARGPDKDRSVA
jgi:hypothetical protein